jgi:hypothetical protein
MEGGSKLSAPMLPRGTVLQTAFLAVQTAQAEFFSRFNCLPDTVDPRGRTVNDRHERQTSRAVPDPHGSRRVRPAVLATSLAETPRG